MTNYRQRCNDKLKRCSFLIGAVVAEDKLKSGERFPVKKKDEFFSRNG